MKRFALAVVALLILSNAVEARQRWPNSRRSQGSRRFARW